MSSIQVLDNSLINKIAAGEVVERPASVVKELMENSIDAGATSITVEIRDGGISLVKITDNGKGIPKDEIKTAFLRHATSKLRNIEDLDDILTLGFRGEALSSIAAVSQVDLVTRTSDSITGNRIIINGGIVEREEEVGANVGTCFTMKNLFYNTPARRKFLKKPATEGGYVSDVVTRIALGHPEIAIKYINNGNTVMQTNGKGDVKSAMLYIYGKQIASQMVEVSYTKDGFCVEGLVAKPELSRGNRNYENFFINGRYIRSTIVQNAVEDAYKGKMMVGKFPVFALNLKVPSSTVDVNVHPTKLEVRFSDDNLIYDIMYNAVNKALKAQELIPSVTWDKAEKIKKQPLGVQSAIEEIIPQNVDYSFSLRSNINDKQVSEEVPAPTAINKQVENGIVINEKIADNSNIEKCKKPIEKITNEFDYIEKYKKQTENTANKFSNNEIGKGTDNKEIVPEKTSFVKATNNIDNDEYKKRPFFNNYRIVGQIFATYWIVEQNNCMYLIDQHAAHERALYEDFMEKYKNEQVSSQQLLTPIAINLSDSEKVVVEENMELLKKFGFEIEEFGIRAYAVRAVPYVFDKPSNVSFFMEIIDTLADKKLQSIYDNREDAIATMSCKAAVKGNSFLDYNEAKELILWLLKLEDPFTCPHGRPTIIEMTKYELEKKFKRIQD